MSARKGSAADQDDNLRAEPPVEDSEQIDLEAWQRLKAMLVKRETERFRRLYARTRNPIHALNAYRLNRKTKNEVPGWILELFDQWAEVLCVKRPTGGKEIVKRPTGGKEIAHALGLGSKGGPSITSKAATQLRDLWIVERVLGLRDLDPDRDKQEIFDQVAEEYKLSSERVTGILYELTRGAKR